MKNSILMMVVVVVFGAAIVFRSTSKDQVDEHGYQYIVDVIEQLSLKDKEINTLIIKSRFGLDQNYDELANISAQIRRQAKSLEQVMREKELFSLGIGIQNYWSTYESYLVEKLDTIESFKGNNSILRNSVNYAPIAGENVIKAVKGLEVEETISSINRTLYKYIISGDRGYLADLKLYVLDLPGVISSIEDRRSKIILNEYFNHLKVVVEKQEDTDNYMMRAINNRNLITLDRIRNVLDNHYRRHSYGEEDSSQLLSRF